MKSFFASTFYLVVVAVGLGAACGGCKSSDFSYSPPPDRRAQPLAPVSAVSAGIGGPGGNSADTRATGTVASGQGDRPLGVTNPATAPIVAPGVAPGSGTSDLRPGGRY